MEDGANWPVMGLGALGIVTLGAALFAVGRKR
jgi:hypothetical protein